VASSAAMLDSIYGHSWFLAKRERVHYSSLVVVDQSRDQKNRLGASGHNCNFSDVTYNRVN
jgi:hypothetical protein